MILAFFSTLGLVSEGNRLNTSIKASEYISKVESTQLIVINWFENYEMYACMEKSENQKCSAFHKALQDLRLILQDPDGFVELPSSLISDLSNIPSLLSTHEKEIVEKRINNYNQTLKAYLLIVENTQQSWLQIFIVLLTPLFFACALALKMTKVTGEYLLYTKNT